MEEDRERERRERERREKWKKTERGEEGVALYSGHERRGTVFHLKPSTSGIFNTK